MSKPLEDAIARMLTHNKWRKGDDTVPMTDSVQLGLDIETVCKAARRTADVEKRLAEAEEYITSFLLIDDGDNRTAWNYSELFSKAREFLGRK